jgi:hypothetical protein
LNCAELQRFADADCWEWRLYDCDVPTVGAEYEVLSQTFDVSDLPLDWNERYCSDSVWGPSIALGLTTKERRMTDEKQNPKQQSERQPQQENKQPSGQQQDRKPVRTPQQQDSQKAQKNTEVKEKQPDQSQNRKAS